MDLIIGNCYDVKVIRILKNGIIVQVGDTSTDTEFIHVSKISTMYVADIANFIEVNKNYTAECISSTLKPAELSLLKLNLKPAGYTVHVDTSKVKDKSYQTTSRKPANIISKPKGNYSNHKSKSNTNSTDLDDMISHANKVFEDKQSRMNSRSRRRQK